jgi:hypothetical protein
MASTTLQQYQQPLWGRMERLAKLFPARRASASFPDRHPPCPSGVEAGDRTPERLAPDPGEAAQANRPERGVGVGGVTQGPPGRGTTPAPPTVARRTLERPGAASAKATIADQGRQRAEEVTEAWPVTGSLDKVLNNLSQQLPPVPLRSGQRHRSAVGLPTRVWRVRLAAPAAACSCRRRLESLVHDASGSAIERRSQHRHDHGPCCRR